MYIYWISIEVTISANFVNGYSLAIQPIFSKIWKFLNLLYLKASFPCKSNILWLFFDNLLKSFSENLKQLTKMNADFLKNLKNPCKNTLVSVYLLNFCFICLPCFPSKIWNILWLKVIFLTFFLTICSRVSVKISNN